MENKQFERLPRYAKMEIQRLRNEVDYHKKRARQVEGKEETNVFVANCLEKDRPLPKNSHIIFALGEDYRDRLEINMEDDDTVRISLNNLSLMPCASNVIYIKKGER